MDMVRSHILAALPLLALVACGNGADKAEAKLERSETANAAMSLADSPPAEAQAAPAQGSGLKPGEYACVGSGGQILIGLGFKLDASGGYTDLDGKERGTTRVSGGLIKFSGGHMDGMEGHDIKNGKEFVLGKMVSCELWG